jgi:hypothetical protein
VRRAFTVLAFEEDRLIGRGILINMPAAAKPTTTPMKNRTVVLSTRLNILLARKKQKHDPIVSPRTARLRYVRLDGLYNSPDERST